MAVHRHSVTIIAKRGLKRHEKIYFQSIYYNNFFSISSILVGVERRRDCASPAHGHCFFGWLVCKNMDRLH